MLNCGKLTEAILIKYLSLFERRENIKDQSMEGIINDWLKFLPYANIAEINTVKAIEDLYRLRILNQASALHDAGDISGKVYKNLWFSLLLFLNKKTNVVKL